MEKSRLFIIFSFSFSANGLAHINNEQAKQLSNVELKPNDILLNITGDSVARTCIIDSEYLPARVNQHVACCPHASFPASRVSGLCRSPAGKPSGPVYEAVASPFFHHLL